MIPGIDEIRSLAVKYSKKQLANMAQTGLIDPQKAVMAGMMRDRISQEDAKPPTSTVAQDVLGIPAAPQAPQAQQPQMGMQQPQQPPPSAGMESLPAGNVGSYAGGGIVAFADGGDTYGGKLWEELSPAGQQPRFASDYITNMFTPQGRRIDPVTGEEISLVQFLDRARKENYPAPQTSYPAKEWDRVAKDVEKGKDVERTKAGAGAADSGIRFPGGVSTRASMPAFSLPKFDQNAIKIQGEEMPTYEQRDRKDIRAARRAAEIEEGVDPEMYSKMIKGIEEKKGKLETKKGESKGAALMQLGLGLLGARRGQEFQTLGESGMKALSAYKQDVKEFDAASEKYDERMEALRMSDQQAKQTGARADVAQAEKDRELAFAAQTEKAKAKNDLAKTSAQVSATVRGQDVQAATSVYTTQLSTQAQKEIANMNAGVQKWVHSQPPAVIQAIDAISQREKIPFGEAMNKYPTMMSGSRNAFTREEAMKQAMKNLGDTGIINPTEAQVQAEINKLMRIYGGGTGGTGGGSLQQGANGTFNYVPASQ